MTNLTLPEAPTGLHFVVKKATGLRGHIVQLRTHRRILGIKVPVRLITIESPSGSYMDTPEDIIKNMAERAISGYWEVYRRAQRSAYLSNERYTHRQWMLTRNALYPQYI